MVRPSLLKLANRGTVPVTAISAAPLSSWGYKTRRVECQLDKNCHPEGDDLRRFGPGGLTICRTISPTLGFFSQPFKGRRAPRGHDVEVAALINSGPCRKLSHSMRRPLCAAA